MSRNEFDVQTAQQSRKLSIKALSLLEVGVVFEVSAGYEENI